MFTLPIFFVFETIFEEDLLTLIEKEISCYKFSKEGYIFKLVNPEQLEAVCKCSEMITAVGYRTGQLFN